MIFTTSPHTKIAQYAVLFWQVTNNSEDKWIMPDSINICTIQLSKHARLKGIKCINSS